MAISKNTCISCCYWEQVKNPSTINCSGYCHYWPPSRSKQFSSIRAAQIESPKIAEVALMILEAEKLQLKLVSDSEKIFANYPVTKSIEELQAARDKVDGNYEKIKHLNERLDREKTENPYISTEIQQVRECGDWPITASDDWCGQWGALGK